MQATIVTKIEELEPLAPEWAGLGEFGATSFPQSSLPWLKAWWRAFGSRTSGLRTIVVSDGGALVCVLPLVIKRRRLGRMVNLRRLQPAGAPLADYCMPSYRGDPARLASVIVEACLAINHEWDELWLCQWLEEDPLTLHLGERLGGLAGRRSVTLPSAQCPYVPVEGGFDAFLKTRSKSLNQTHRSALNKLAREGLQLEYTMHATVDRALLDRLSAISSDSRHTTDYLSREMAAFLENLSGLCDPQFRLEAWFAQIDGVAHAFALCVADERRRYYWLVGADSFGKQYSLGGLLLQHILASTFAEPLREFDFLRGTEGYKMRWAEQCRNLVNVGLLAPSGARQAGLRLQLSLQNLLDRLRQKGHAVEEMILVEEYGLF